MRITRTRKGPTLPPPAPAKTATARGLARRDAVVVAATAEFLTYGFAGATVARIVKAAGGSTSTVYKEFGGKEGLFIEVLAQKAREVESMMNGIEVGVLSLEDGMLAYGTAYLDVMLRTEIGSFYPIVMSESSRFPELRALLTCVASHTRETVANFMSAKVTEHSLGIKFPRRAAQTFVTLLRGHFLEVKMDMIKNVSTEQFLREAVRMTINAYSAG